MTTPNEFLDQVEIELNGMDGDESVFGMDRREFVFLSLMSAAASAFGVTAVARAQAAGGRPQ